MSGSALNIGDCAFEARPLSAGDRLREHSVPAAACIEEIIFPDDGDLRIRKVVKRSNARTTGKHPSPKNRRMMQYESFGELHVFLHLECMPEVIRYHEQPCKIVFREDGNLRLHYPDLLVEFAGRKELWEVKRRSEAEEPDMLRRADLMRQLVQWGYEYRVVIAEEYKIQPRLNNIAKLVRFGYHPISMSEREEIRLLLIREQFLSWGQACAGVYGERGREVVCRLVLEGKLNFDLDAHWSPLTQFSVREGL